MKPFFSIVIPTLNRVNLVKLAINSVLNQTYKNYEIIVVDSQSVDGTEDAVKSFKSDKISYCNAPEGTSSPAAWEYGAVRANGDFVVELADDDYFMPDILQNIADVIESKNPDAVLTALATYHYPDFYEKELQNTLMVLNSYSNVVSKIDLKKLLTLMFSFRTKDYIKSIHSATFISKKIIEKIRKKHGIFFDDPLPDYTAFTRTFAIAKDVYFIDKPLVIVGRPPTSWSIDYSKLKNKDQINKKRILPIIHAPLKGQYMANYAAESFLRCKNTDPDLFKDYDLALDEYAFAYYFDMSMATQNGRDNKDDVAEFEKWLKALPSNYDETKKKINNLNLKRFIKKIMTMMMLYEGFNYMRNKLFQSKDGSLKLVKLGSNVKNIEDSSVVLKDMVK